MTTDNKVQFDDAKLSLGDNPSITINTMTTSSSTLEYNSQSNNARTNNNSLAFIGGTISFNSTTNN